MRLGNACLLLGLCLAVASCGSPSPQVLILGTWELVEGPQRGRIEFQKDGTVRGTEGMVSLNGRYQWLDDKTVEVKFDNPFSGFPAPVSKMAEQLLNRRFTIVSLTRQELVATDQTGVQLRFKRVQ